jgi:hypothetical protein
MVLAGAAAAKLGFAGCSPTSAPSPFDPPSGGGSAGAEVAASGGVPVDGGPRDPTIGNPCQDDGQCDDGIECTEDECVASLGRCRHSPDPTPCANDVFCDGEEICDPGAGCVPGVPVSCSDDDTCTVDTCVEATQSCQHEPRDADEDGDPDGNCGGGDCDDADPFVSSAAAEICGNGSDDNCDGDVDEPGCTPSEHDVCSGALGVEGSGRFELPLRGAVGDYAASCAGDAWRDVVVAFTTDGPTTIDVVASSEAGNLALAVFDLCGDASSEVVCERAATSVPNGGTVGRVRFDATEAQTVAMTVFSDRDFPVWLDVDYGPLAPAANNETCSTAVELPVAEPFVVSIVGLDADLPSACSTTQGDAVYELVTATPVDLEVFAVSTDGYGKPVLSLFAESCQAASREVTCRKDDPAVLFARGLPAGHHFLGVSATGPSDIQVVADVTEATAVPADDDCDDPPELVVGEALDLSFVGRADDVALECLPGATDVVYSLELEEPSDLQLLQRLSDGDRGALALLPADCDATRALSCVEGARSPVRAALRDVAPGEYRVVVASQDGTPAEVSALVRAAQPPLLVAFADTCDEAVLVPEAGALLTGSTATATADYSAGCDQGGAGDGGAPDQVLRLVLDERKRVVLDMAESGFETLLDVRRGPSCPGEEVASGCSAGYVSGRSFLDLTLEPGEYWLQIDGYDGASGNWVLDAFIADP